MTPDRTKPGLAFYATIILLVVLVLYPLSFGPACWITSRTGIGVNALPAIYRPIIASMNPAGLTRVMPAGSYENTCSYATVPPTQTLHFYPLGIVSRYATLLSVEGWRWRQSFDYSMDSDDQMDIHGAGQWVWSMSGP